MDKKSSVKNESLNKLAETATRESIKMAYPKAAIGSITAGVDSNRNPVVGYLGNQPGVRQEAQ